ncbi:hypothetical protein EYC84_010480 [Monilinia fructicola]|uniref:Uncharacterized protein n=1 Tax=Monilinia fructicola TaxID=38448 RepID=A0A5M9JIB4_MONFR|nr:hypothetical protein EYC84_010480 [Monilinia fructicola]
MTVGLMVKYEGLDLWIIESLNRPLGLIYIVIIIIIIIIIITASIHCPASPYFERGLAISKPCLQVCVSLGRIDDPETSYKSFLSHTQQAHGSLVEIT